MRQNSKKIIKKSFKSTFSLLKFQILDKIAPKLAEMRTEESYTYT